MIVYVVDTETTGLGMTTSGRVKITVTKQHKDSGVRTDVRLPEPFFQVPMTKSLSRSKLVASASSRKKTRTENKLIHVNYLVYM